MHEIYRVCLTLETSNPAALSSDAAGTAASSASSKECLHTECYQHTATDIPGHGWGDLWNYELKLPGSLSQGARHVPVPGRRR